MRAMGLDTEAEGSAMQFLRRGYKVGPALCMLLGALCLPWGGAALRPGGLGAWAAGGAARCCWGGLQSLLWRLAAVQNLGCWPVWVQCC
jgi:hypothetical protein